MCGIVGLVSVANSDGRQRVDRALASIAHRGPDGAGYYNDREVHLGHRRLAIIDRRAASDQPMLSCGDDYVIVFNGEIYNYVELKERLVDKGVSFNTASDTEVILRSYELYGEGCVEEFNGMWSFAIYDKRRRRLFCSRDRFGEKPFLFHCKGREFYFASEVKALIALGVETRLDPGYLASFLFWERYERPFSSQFVGVSYLPGGHSLSFDVESGDCRIWRYYDLRNKVKDLSGTKFEEATKEFHQRLRESVRLRNRSDVPVGVALSGGVDSTLIAVELSKLTQDKLIPQPLAINADAETVNESESAVALASATKLGIPLRCASAQIDDLLGVLLKAHWHQEAPATSMSFIMSWMVYEQFRKNDVPVALDGQGGDEILLGYPRYISIPIFELLTAGDIRGLAKLVNDAGRNSDDFARRRMFGLSLWGWSNTFKTVNRLLRAHMWPDSKTLFPGTEDAHTALRRRIPAQIQEIESSVLPGLLRTADRNSMAHSVEARLPYLDPSVVEYAVSLPTSVKFHEGWSKAPSRALLSNAGLDEAGRGRRKLGFQGPDQIWMDRLGSIPFDYVSRSPFLKATMRSRLTRDRFGHLPSREQFKLFSLAIVETQFGVG